MWDAYDMGNEEILWAGIPFMGGIGGFQQAPCGAVSASAVYLGLRHRAPLSDRENARRGRSSARFYAGMLVAHFNRHFGDITCRGLLGIDFTKPGAYQTFRESGLWKEKCNKYVEFIIERLYEYEDGNRPEGEAREKNTIG